jgi:hypothetical protein
VLGSWSIRSMFAQISGQIADAVWTLFAEAKTAGAHRL